MFADLISKTMEVYVDNMSFKTKDHMKYLKTTFQILRRYKTRINPLSVHLVLSLESS